MPCCIPQGSIQAEGQWAAVTGRCCCFRLLFLPPQCGGTRTRRDPRNAAAAMASRKAAAAAQGNGLAAAGRDRAHLELAELGPLLEEKGEQGAAGTVSVRRPARHRVGPVLRD